MVVLRRGPGALSWLAIFWLFPSLVISGIVNRTIDDSFGDSQTGLLPVYLPGGGVWKDETCIGCAINPNVASTFKETYTAATYNPGLGSMNITMLFNGTAIYVFFILANNEGDGITTLTMANFTLDGNTPQLFQHAPDLTTANLQFNQLVFSQTNLVNAQHTLVISTSGVNTNVYVNFDYAIYTHDDDAPLQPLPGSSTSTTPSPATTSTTPTKDATTTKPRATATKTQTQTASQSTSALDNTSSTKSSTNTGAIVGGVIAAIVVVALIAFFIFYFRRRRGRQTNAREDGGYVPPMVELDPEQDGQRATISTFVQQTPSTAWGTGTMPQQGYGRVPDSSMSRLSVPLSNNEPLMSPPADIESAYGGYITPTASSQPTSSENNSGPSNSESDRHHQGQRRRGPLRSVTAGDHLSSTEDTSSTSALQTPNSIEAIRLARQNELDQRLRTVQEEMRYLASDLSSGEKSGRSRSIRRRTTNRARHGEDAEVAEEEMSMSDMREQLRAMREQITYLQDQQRSAWAQGLSDDPPPGYTPERMSLGYLAPLPTVSPLES